LFQAVTPEPLQQ